MLKRIRVLSVLAAIAAGLLTVAQAAFLGQPAWAANGGCNPHIRVNGWDVGVCISDRGQKQLLFPDIYLNTVGTHGSSCTVYIEVWYDGGLLDTRDGGHPCVSSKTPYDDTQSPIFHPTGCYFGVHAHAFYYSDNKTFQIGDSPSFDYCSTV
jgi:hypothetical protein